MCVPPGVCVECVCPARVSSVLSVFQRGNSVWPLRVPEFLPEGPLFLNVSADGNDLQVNRRSKAVAERALVPERCDPPQRDFRDCVLALCVGPARDGACVTSV